MTNQVHAYAGSAGGGNPTDLDAAPAAPVSGPHPSLRDSGSVAGVVLERHAESHAEIHDATVLDGEVLSDDLGDAEVPNGLGSRLDGSVRSPALRVSTSWTPKYFR